MRASSARSSSLSGVDASLTALRINARSVSGRRSASPAVIARNEVGGCGASVGFGARSGMAPPLNFDSGSTTKP